MAGIENNFETYILEFQLLHDFTAFCVMQKWSMIGKTKVKLRICQ